MDLLIPGYIKYQLYLLQLENYELGRYWALLRAKGFFPGSQPQRKELVWTAKARALLLMAAALHLLLAIAVALVVAVVWPGIDSVFTALVMAFLLLLPFYFVLFSGALLAIHPLDFYIKNQLAQRTRAKLSSMPNLKIIGIAGSYGKTTMKEVLTQVLSIKYKVLSTPESVNTPVGISQFILNKLVPETKILILELGEHYRGDVKELCQIAPPDIAVITGINEAHLERMETLGNVTATIFEAAEFAKESALVVLNGDDENIITNFKTYTGGREVRFYSSWSGMTDYKVLEKNFNPEKLCWNFSVELRGDFIVQLLGDYAVGTSVAALGVGEYLGLTAAQVRAGLSQVKPVEHRLQPLSGASNVLVIDDGYNGNPSGAAEAIKVLEQFSGRRKIYLTPGLVETGNAAAEVHRQIGRQLAEVADVVILIKDSVTPFIAEGLAAKGFAPDKIYFFNSALEAHGGLKLIIQPGDVVLFQNDWGDQYV